jgi:hypothetical protein
VALRCLTVDANPSFLAARVLLGRNGVDLMTTSS